MSTRRKILFGALGGYLLVIVGILLIFGFSRRDNEAFQPQEEFRLTTWIDLPGELDINKAVLYLLVSALLTVLTMVFVARRMQARPNRVQTAVETIYTLMRDNITRGNMDDRMAAKWFPFVATLFLFIWFNNLIGYIPTPTGHEHVEVFGLEIPTFALYAATANLSIPLVLTLVVWIAYHVEGVRHKGFFPYLASWLPPGLENMNIFGKAFFFVIEAISHFARLISLSVRLFANILAGHLLLLFMGGGLAVLLGIAALGLITFPLAFAFFLLEVGLIATLQAFIFSTLTAIYLGGATSESH